MAYSSLIQAKHDPGVASQIERAARAQGTTISEWSRQAHRTALQLQGYDPAPIVPHDAGTLYDSQNGKGCYALVSAGRVLGVVNYADRPDLADVNHHPAGYVPADGDAWLPIMHLDSEPFDPSLHWRLPHIEHVQADRLVREFPVVPKSWEYA